MAVANQHPDRAELAAFSLGTLDDLASASVEVHVADCPTCQERAADTPCDDLVEFLRGVHARMGHQTDTVTGTAPSQTPASLSLETIGLPSAESNGTDAVEDLPSELVGHDRYRIVRLLGKGGMGKVYVAEHRVMRRSVALKVVHRAFVSSPTVADRFRREVRAASRLSHPNVVTTYDAEDIGDKLFLVMEFVVGVTLGSLVKERGPLPVAEACDCVRQAALGLQHAHERGMVHRDIKPDNLIRCGDGTVKILDFGLARLGLVADVIASDALSAGGTGAEDLTEQGCLMGTPYYMAPEQAKDARTADIRADVYSLGCTLYYLLTGMVPYPAATTELKLRAHREQPLPSIFQARPDVPPDMADLLARLLAKKPEDRYQTPGEVAAALVPFAAPRAAVVEVGASRRRPRRRFLIASLAALLLVGAAVAGAVEYRIRTDNGELVITTESDAVEVVIKQGGKLVRIIDTKTDKRISLALRSGVYELELKGADAGLKLEIVEATVKRGDTVLAKIERVSPKPLAGAATACPGKIEIIRRIPVSGAGNFLYWTAVSKGGKYALVTRDITRGVKLDVFNVATGERIFECAGYMAEFLNAEEILVQAEGRFRVYHASTGKVVRESAHRRDLCNLVVAPGGKHLVYSGSKEVYLYDTTKMQQLHAWEGTIGEARIDYYALFSPDGKRLLLRPKVGQWIGWDVEGNCPAKDFEVPNDVAEALHFFPDGKTAAVVRLGELVRVDLRTAMVVAKLPNRPVAGVWESAYSRDGRCYLVRFVDDGRVSQYRTPFAGQQLGRFQLPPDDLRLPRGLRAVAISEDDRYATVLTANALYVLRLLPLDAPAKAQP